MTKRWLWLIGLIVLAAPQMRAQMTAVSALVMDTAGERYVNCSWSVVFVGQNNVPGAGPYQPAALLVGQQGHCDSSGNLTVSLADNIATVRPTPSQWNFSICSAPGYVPGGTYCRSNMLVTVTGATQNLTSFFQPLMPLLPTGGGGGGGSGFITDATPLGGLMKTGTTLGLQTTCVAGQYMGWNGSAWACTGAGVGGGTSVTVNGTTAVPNLLNFTNTLLPPSGSSVVNFLLNGNTVGAYVTGTGGGGGGSLTVNGGPGGSDLNDRLPAFPPNGINISWQAANGHISGAIVGDGIATHCFLGTGVFALCPGGGGGGGGTFPTTPQFDLFASTGAGAATASGVKGGSGFLQGQVLTSTGDVTSNPSPFPALPNASVEYFPQGAVFGSLTVGAANGLAAYFSHSATTGAAPGFNNGGVMLGGGNSSGTNYQVYVDCESSPTLGCDFKVPLTVNGGAVGGGGGGLPTIPAWNLFASDGAGSAQDSNVAAEAGFLRAQVLESTGNTAPSAPSGFTPPNGSVEYFPLGATYGGITAGALNGIALHFSHSGKTGSAGNGGVGLAGGNATGTASSYQIYVDCEQVGCDFKVPVTYLGTGIGGGGGGSGTVGSGTAGFFTWYQATGTAVTSNTHLDDGVTTATTITSQETLAAPGINVTGNGGIAMTGTGGSLPAPVANQGGLGIAPGNIPSFYSNGGPWTAIGSGGGTALSINGTAAGSALNLTNTATTPPANGRPITWTAPASGASSGYLVGDGSTNCLNGQGAYVTCGGGGGGGGGTGSIGHGAQATTCLADSTAAAAPEHLVFSGLTINVGDTVMVGVGAYNVGTMTYSVVDGSGNTYALQTNIAGSTVQTFVFASLNVTQAANTLTVTRNATTAKFTACVTTYTGVANIGVQATNSGAAATTQLLSLTASGAGHVLYSVLGQGGPSIATFSIPNTANGTLLGQVANTASSTSSIAACENTSAAAGSLSCTTTSNQSMAWSGVGVELIPAAAPPTTITGATLNGGLLQTGTTLGLQTCTANQYLSWISGVWTCTAAPSSGATLPTTPQYDLFASTGAGAAQASGVQATGGFIKSGASIVSGTAASSPFTGANASQEFYNSGGTITPSTGPPITFANGAALFMGHGASTAGATGDAGIALGGGSATPTSRVYLDCEVAGCDFKVPLTLNGSAIGGSSSLSGLTPATTAHTLANANFPQRWNWAQTVDSQSGMALGEDTTTPTPSTGGTVLTGPAPTPNGIANQKAVSIETAAGSTAVPLNVTQGSMTGATAATSVPAFQVQTTWNNGAAGPQDRAFVLSVISTASNVNSLMADFQLGGNSVFQVNKNGDLGLASNRYIGPMSPTNNMTICGGGVAGIISTAAATCASSTGTAVGGVIIRGGDNSSTGATAVGGIALLRGGFLNQGSGFPAGVEGTAQVVEGYSAGTTGITAGTVVCMTTAAYQVVACPTGAQNVVGIAGTPTLATAGAAVPVVSYGTMVIALDNTATIGDVVCMSTTAAGQGHDNALVACTAPNFSLGVVIQTTGNFLSASGQSTASSALSTSLPAVQLRIGH